VHVGVELSSVGGTGAQAADDLQGDRRTIPDARDVHDVDLERVRSRRLRPSDTSPSGTGTSAAMALLAARGDLGAGDTFVTEGLLGAVFRCGVSAVAGVGGMPAIVPRIGGRAWITGYAQYVLADDDPFPEGFVIGDIWPSAELGSEAQVLSDERRALN